jgi:hypothetical protein
VQSRPGSPLSPDDAARDAPAPPADQAQPDRTLTRLDRLTTKRPARGRISGVPTLYLSQDDAADELLSRDPLALLIGMLLDQYMRQRSSTTRPVV